METLTLTQIGVVHTESEEIEADWRRSVSEIHLDEAYIEGLVGLEDWSHIVVIFSMHEVNFDATEHMRGRPDGREDMPDVGVFAQRGRFTPNKIGMTAVRLDKIDGTVLTVKGLDAIDGTPVLDIKPYAPIYDGAADPLVPVWFLRLMQG